MDNQNETNGNVSSNSDLTAANTNVESNMNPHAVAATPEIRILLPEDKASIIEFAKSRLRLNHTDPMEAEMLSWSAPWRAESLDHYLPQGWCFGVFEADHMTGFIIAQPVLFFRGRTQTLWIEHLQFSNEQAARLLIDTVSRWARDKHLQSVFVENSVELEPILKDWPRATKSETKDFEIRTSRFQ